MEMSISHYLSVTSITERKYLNRYAKRKEYIKEHGEEPPQSLLDDLSDSPDTCFCREIEIVRSGVIQSYFLELLCDKWDSNPKKYKCLQGMFDVNNSYDLLSNFNQFFFFLSKEDIEEVLASIQFDLAQEKIFENLSEETQKAIKEYLEDTIEFDEMEGAVCYDPFFETDHADYKGDWSVDMSSLTSFYFALLRIQRLAPVYKEEGFRGIYYHYWF